MPITIASDMFTITIDGARAEIKIVRNPEVDSARGAQRAEEVTNEAARLPARGVREIVLDVRDAPPVSGPKTSAAIGGMLEAWERTRVRVAVLVGDDPVHRLQWKRLATEHAPQSVHVLTSTDDLDDFFAAASPRGGR